jgi:hypothetical protein
LFFIPYPPATEVVLLLKLGGNKVFRRAQFKIQNLKFKIPKNFSKKILFVENFFISLGVDFFVGIICFVEKA